MQSFIALFVGFMGMHNVISKLYYKGTILQRNYRKMIMVVIIINFPIIPFLKFCGIKFLKPQHDNVISKPCYKRGVL